MLDSRAIATLGLGYGAALVARIGLWPVAQETVPGGFFRAQKRTYPQRRRREDEELLLFFS